MRRPPGHCLMAWWRRCLNRARSAPRTWRQFGIGRYTGSQTSTKLKVTGIDLFSAGNFMGAKTGKPEDAGCEEIVMSDPFGGVYKKLVIQNDKLVGAVPVRRHGGRQSWYFKLLREGRNLGDIRDKLMFGESNIGDVGHQGHNKRGGHGRHRRGLRLQRHHQGHASARPSRKRACSRWKRCASRPRPAPVCGGSCTGLVEQLLDVHRRWRLLAPRPSSRPCAAAPTPWPPGNVRDAIREHHLLTIARRVRSHDELAHAQRLQQLPPGHQLLPAQHLAQGSRGRPPKPLHQRAQPRQHPERRQLLASFRACGGERPTASELRRIADAVDKFKIRTVKVTGGQRIDLLGVKKEDLPVDVWKDIGMPSGHAYAKALRTVKTCVGSEWCRFGTQDSAHKWARTWNAPCGACTHRTR